MRFHIGEIQQNYVFYTLHYYSPSPLIVGRGRDMQPAARLNLFERHAAVCSRLIFGGSLAGCHNCGNTESDWTAASENVIGYVSSPARR